MNLRNEDRHPVITFQAEEQVQMNMPEGNFNLHGNAISQISEKMGIPAKYLRELSAGDAWQKQLCATILNEHSGWTGRTRVLIRAVGTEIRGVLSDSYRRLNSVDDVGQEIVEYIDGIESVCVGEIRYQLLKRTDRGRGFVFCHCYFFL